MHFCKTLLFFNRLIQQIGHICLNLTKVKVKSEQILICELYHILHIFYKLDVFIKKYFNFKQLKNKTASL